MSKGWEAQETIYICRVVTTVGASADFNVLTPADGTVCPLGISGQDSKYPQIEGYTSNDTVHRETGDAVVVHRPGQFSEQNSTVYGWAGGTITRGAPVMAKNDGSGKLVAATTGKWVVGFADQAGSDGELIPITPSIFFLGTVS